jgi:hypothetical protein
MTYGNPWDTHTRQFFGLGKAQNHSSNCKPLNWRLISFEPAGDQLL